VGAANDGRTKAAAGGALAVQRGSGKFSPHGQWIAYVSNESGRDEIYIQGFLKAASRTQISTAGGVRPHWRQDGKELFFTAQRFLINTRCQQAGSVVTPITVIVNWDRRDGPAKRQ
jgi:Tol biopolymer transport system component